MLNKELFEKLAAIEHERWADWQEYMFSRCAKHKDGTLTIAASNVKHWQRQIDTPYADLTEEEKDSDREQVRSYWESIGGTHAEHAGI